jgi:hypothetical protein
MSHPVLGVNQADVILRKVDKTVAVDTNKSFHGGIPFGLATPFAEMHLPRKWKMETMQAGTMCPYTLRRRTPSMPVL